MPDWRPDVIDAARDDLTAPGGVVVRLDRDGCSVVSRLYRLADYESTNLLRQVVVTRATRLLNADSEGWNYYAVLRYPDKDDTIVAWTGMHSILIESTV